MNDGQVDTSFSANWRRLADAYFGLLHSSMDEVHGSALRAAYDEAVRHAEAAYQVLIGHADAELHQRVAK